MTDAPTREPYVLKPAHLQDLRYSISRAKLVGHNLYPIDVQRLEALINAAEKTVGKWNPTEEKD